eukprot:TRINITY_DN4728_c0_g2_i3.p1 TRINITY_DN4728_c0_g2~~TRINITY_DN4728_c0_g2_i3.p1  ORF type:complete len:188 (-),score=30.62 TRINITY_DN4728_c0_g2_i3:347-910(-)
MCIRDRSTQSTWVTASDDTTIRIWELVYNTPVFTLSAHKGPVTGMLIIEETGHLVSCSSDGVIHAWDYPRKQVVKTFEKKETFNCLAYLASIGTLFAGCEEENIDLFPIDDILANPIEVELNLGADVKRSGVKGLDKKNSIMTKAASKLYTEESKQPETDLDYLKELERRNEEILKELGAKQQKGGK